MDMRLCCVPFLNSEDEIEIKNVITYLENIKNMICKCGMASDYAEKITDTIVVLHLIKDECPLE